MPDARKDLDPKLVIGIIVVVVLIAGGVLYSHFRTPPDFAGPKVEIKPPKGFAIPTVGGRPGAPGAPPGAAGGPGAPGAPGAGGAGGGRPPGAPAGPPN